MGGRSGVNGTVVFNGTTEGLVCADGVDGKTAAMLCNAAGYRYLVGYNATQHVNYDKLDCDSMAASGISVVAEDLDCPSNASTLYYDCQADKSTDGSCSVDDALWLDCTNDEAEQWQLVNVTMARNTPGNHNYWNVETGTTGGKL